MKINKYLLTACSFVIANFAIAQLADGFDIKKAYNDARQKGIMASDIEGYVKFLHNDFLSHKNTSHTQSAANGGVLNLGTIYLNGNGQANMPTSPAPAPPAPNTPQNAYCPNAGFEQMTFANWTGGYGTVANGGAGAPFPIYNQTSPTIVNGAGNNASLVNTLNYHTVMTTPPTASVYPNCVGYDSIACKVIGTQTVSEIPVVNPIGGPASVRLNGAMPNYRASKLTYNMSLNPNNKNFSVSYALVLENGTHTPDDQPYFSVKVTDQNGNLVPGCSVYTVTCNSDLTNPASPLYDPTWTDAVIGYGVMYRKWSTYAFDFSNYPAITSVNVEFYVGGCAQSGHYGYAYVDASCSQGGAVTSFCAGSNSAIINAPIGYSTYQWTGPSGPVSVTNGGNTSSATITPVTAGQVFTCAVTAPNGCSSIFQTTVSITTVSITGMNSTPSCPNGGSGTTAVAATGSSNGYVYQWVNSSNTTVGTGQTASGLSPGNYTVNVSSPGCGSATSTVAVAISPPTFYSLAAPYCGSVAWITKTGGTNYKWYTVSPLAQIAGATSQSLTINSPVAGTQYILAYTTASGCKDSIKYTLTQTPGGSIYVSNIKSICPGNSNSYAVVNLQTTAPPAYSYTVTGPAGYSSILTNTTSLKDSVINLSIGTYSTTVFDGQCLYNTTFTVSPFVFTYTLSPSTSTICTNSGGAPLTVNFCNTNTSGACGLSTTSGCSTAPNSVNLGTGTGQNFSNGWPSIYGNWYKNNRHQLLYTAAELSAAGVLPGKISSISFNISSIPSGYIGTIPGLTIKVKCTSANALTNTFDNTGLLQVYTAANYSPVTGWNTHQFNTSYDWDGISNLLVDVCYTWNPSSAYTTNPFQLLTSTPVVRCIYEYSDSSPMCGSTGFATTSLDRPNTKFDNAPGYNPNQFTYTWLPAAGLSSSTSYSTIATPTTSTIYTVQVSPLGQTNCMQTQSTAVTIVNPASPTITAVNPMCTNGAPLTLTATPTGGIWSGSGISTTGLLTPSLSVAGNNTYTYTVGSGTCSAIGNTTISIEQFIPSTITSSINPQCNTNPALALPTTTSLTGVWTGTGVSGTNFDPSTAIVGINTLTYSTHSNPTATLCPSQSTIAVSVSSITQPTISAAGPYCDNFATQTMTVNPIGGGTGVWGTSTIGSAITTTGDFNPATSIVGNNTLTYTLTNGPCVATTSINVQVVHFIDASFSANVGPYCIYNPAVDLQAVALNAGGVWSGVGVSGTNFDPATAGAGTHQVKYTTDPAPAGLCPDRDSMNIVVNPIPVVVPLAQIYAGCNYPFVANFFTPSVNTGTLTWNYGDGSVTEDGFNPSHTYTSPGTYTVTTSFVDNVGCTATSTVATLITVYVVPDAAFDPTPDVTTVVDAEVVFTNLTTNVANNTYVWDFAGLGGSTDTNPTYLFTNSGEFFVTLYVTSPDGCLDNTVRKVTVNPDVVLYVPNSFTPNGDGLNDEFQIFLPPTGVDYSTFSLAIYDRWGSVIYKTNDVYSFWKGSKNNSGDVVKQDAYVYKISFKDEKKKYYEKVGYVTVIGGK